MIVEYENNGHTSPGGSQNGYRAPDIDLRHTHILRYAPSHGPG